MPLKFRTFVKLNRYFGLDMPLKFKLFEKLNRLRLDKVMPLKLNILRN
jgi:hypothetical protein